MKYNVKVILAYYPPYHSKYNPIERVWGRLEQHWNGNLLDSQDAVLGFAKSMTWKKKGYIHKADNKLQVHLQLSCKTFNLFANCLIKLILSPASVPYCHLHQAATGYSVELANTTSPICGVIMLTFSSFAAFVTRSIGSVQS